MPDPLVIPTRKRRVAIRAETLRKIERHKKGLEAAIREALDYNPLAMGMIAPNPGPLKPIRELVEEYFSNQPQWRPATLENRRRILSRFVDFVGPRPLTREIIEDYARALHADTTYSPRTLWLMGTAVAIFVNWLYETNRISHNWRRGINFPEKPPQQPRGTYSEEEYRKLVEAAGDRPIGFIVKLAWHTGMAMVDCCDLKWGDVDMEKGTIRRKRTKTQVEAVLTFEFGGELHRALEAQYEDTRRAFNSVVPAYPVCRWAAGNKYSIQKLFRRLVAKAGLPHRSFHSWRATLLTEMVSKNVPLNAALKISGLRSVQQLMNYASADTGLIREHLGRLRA